ncbi:unnamed protein product, partial [Effrenium voratum]
MADDEGDGLTAADRQKYSEAFNIFDKHQQGYLQWRPDFANLWRAIGQNPTEADIRRILDENNAIGGTGHFTLETFLKLCENREDNLRKEQLIEAFKTFDKDGKGTLTIAQIRYVLMTMGDPLTDEEADRFIDFADKNKEGPGLSLCAHAEIDYEELVERLDDLDPGDKVSRPLPELAQPHKGPCISRSIVRGIVQVDIMQQCVNLQLDSGHNHEVGDTDAYREVVADFAQKLWQGITAWVSLEPGEYQQGILHRVNQEDEHLVTYDFQYSKQVQEGGKSVSKSFIVKDRPRHQIKTRQLMVKGDPAGGKTTFAKQLLTWIMRTEDAKWLVPVMVRTIDLVRSHEQFADDGRDMVDQYLGMLYRDTGHWELLALARLHGRLLVILDGFDEAGHLERQLGREISSKLNNEVFLIVTSREMSGVLSGSDFARFRSVRVKELNEDQRRQVIRRRLTDASHGEEAVQAFCNQLTLNPALCAMTRNPLLLNVTLSVYQTADGTLGGSLNRGKVYGLALDGMLSNLERAKAVGGSPVTSNLRKVLKS